ncbi:MAG: choline/ethanolamine kinase [Amphiamblys sp. WSBS2006]|nr:MAG: choline/ethanolamine kinase [Amphiamblys sp. WSBS2006]
MSQSSRCANRVVEVNVFLHEEGAEREIEKLLKSMVTYNKLLEIKRITSAATNTAFMCVLGGGETDRVFVRINGEMTRGLVDREEEKKNMKKLFVLGLWEILVGTFANGIVLRGCRGKEIGNETLLERGPGLQVARKIRGWHEKTRAEYGDVCLFDRMRGFVSGFCVGKEEGWEGIEEETVFVEQEIEFLRARIEKSEFRNLVSLCHNDLHHMNIIYDEESKSMEFIDLEFCFENFCLYDVGVYFEALCDYTNFCQGVSREYQLEWLSEYFCGDTEMAQKAYRELPLYGMCTNLFWMIYTVYLRNQTNTDYDYEKWYYLFKKSFLAKRRMFETDM